MRTKRWAGALIATGTVAAVVSAVPTAANAAATTLTIQVGGDSAVSGVGFEGMRFLAPPTLTVHKGDTLKFNFAGFHTATLLPAGVGAQDWRADHTGPGGDFALLQRDADDSHLTFELNKNVLVPTDPTCGSASNPCAYNGTSVVNSGLPLQTTNFSVTVNSNPGQSFSVACLVHDGMQTRIQVVADNVATTTQSQIDSYRSSTLANDHDTAAALIPKLQKQTRHKTASGHWVWDAYAGYDGNGFGLDGMFPHTLHILKGQTVRWHFAQLLGNLHTVTFPRSTAAKLADFDFAGQNVKCESGSTDTGPTAPPPAFCSSGFQNAEFEIRAIAVVQQGGNRYFGTGLRSSGVRGAGVSAKSYNLTFEKRSSKTGWRYACAIHGSMMSGAVVVR